MRSLLHPATLVLLTLAGPVASAPNRAPHPGLKPDSAQLGQPRRGNSCGASKDMVVQALERLRPDSPRPDIERADEDLKRAADLCADTADAFYYRALVEEKLGNQPRAESAMHQARMLDSQAARESLNPFILAAPLRIASSAARGQGAGAPGQPGAAAATSAPRKWALIIGLSQFTDPAVSHLKYTLQDATELAAELADPKIGRFDPEHVRLLTNAQATTRNIKTELNSIARQAQPNDLVLIYVATHGSPRKLDSVGGVNYLVTYDTEIYHAGKFDEDAMYATAFPMVELANAVANRMKALKTVVILDTCYSGGAAGPQAGSAARLKDSVASADMITHISQGAGRVVISASSADEESHESTQLAHGYFTYYFLQALKASQPGTPLTQLFAMVSKNVTQLASESGVAQHPVLYQSSDSADFPIAGAPATISLNRNSAPPGATNSNRLKTLASHGIDSNNFSNLVPR